MTSDNGCIDCQRCPARNHLSGAGPLCDRCFDDRLSAATGWPRLPDPPPPTAVTGPDGHEHSVFFRLWRAPTVIIAEATSDLEPDTGYDVEILGDHDADPYMLAA